jgi:three-Cys-motif partner protein
MEQVVIENPVINSPFEEPKRHFRFSAEGITNEIVESRRISAYFIPIAAPKKKSKQAQLSFETEWTQDRVEENKFINRVRERVKMWRQGGYLGVTKITSRLFFGWEDKTDNEAVAKAFRDRLKKVAGFAYVPEPSPMRNSKGATIYYLFFASQKPAAADIVTDIFNKYRNK